MEQTIIYGLIGLLHIIGFIILLIVLKLGYRKIISSNIIVRYIGIWLIGLFLVSIIFVIIRWSSLKYPIESIFATLGELIGFAIGFFIIDWIIFSIGKWIYQKINRNKVNE